MFCSMTAGLSWTCAGRKQLDPAQDQFKPAQTSTHALKHT